MTTLKSQTLRTKLVCFWKSCFQSNPGLLRGEGRVEIKSLKKSVCSFRVTLLNLGSSKISTNSTLLFTKKAWTQCWFRNSSDTTDYSKLCSRRLKMPKKPWKDWLSWASNLKRWQIHSSTSKFLRFGLALASSPWSLWVPGLKIWPVAFSSSRSGSIRALPTSSGSVVSSSLRLSSQALFRTTPGSTSSQSIVSSSRSKWWTARATLR